MNKKDIYEHLANIYLDAAQKRRVRVQSPQLKNQLFVTLSISLVASLTVITFVINPNIFTRQSAKDLIVFTNTIKLNNDINPVDHNIHNIDLQRKSYKHFTTLQFKARKTNFPNKVRLRIEMLNPQKQRASVYVNNITTKWQTYSVTLKDFKQITDWSKMLKLSFIMESNTIEPHKHNLLINEIKFIK